MFDGSSYEGSFINNKMEYGTEVQLVEVVNTYDSGEMDVVCIARQVFKLLTFDNQMQDKLYVNDVFCPLW